LAVLNDRSGARPGWIGNLVRTLVFVRPQDLTRGFFQAQNALLAGHSVSGKGIGWILDALGQKPIGDIHSATCHGRPRIAAADFPFPADLGAVLGKACQDTTLAPDAVALGTEPLWPIVGPAYAGAEQDRRQGQAAGQRFVDVMVS